MDRVVDIIVGGSSLKAIADVLRREAFTTLKKGIPHSRILMWIRFGRCDHGQDACRAGSFYPLC
jgi:hypothetical protein